MRRRNTLEDLPLRIVGALAFYLEPPEFLDRCVRSLAGVVDHLVCLDGAWRLFPDAEPVSTEAEWEALDDAAEAVGLSLETRRPYGLFASQVEKRAALMEWASERGDWTLVIDGDEHVTRCEPSIVRTLLAGTDRDVAEVALTNRHQGRTLNGGLTRRFYRAGTTVETVHSGYTYQGRQLLPGEPVLDLTNYLHIEHDYANRGPERNEQAAEYRRRRQAEREEVWV